MRPVLRPTGRDARPRLSDDGFYDSVASLALCSGLDVALTTADGTFLSYRALSEANLGVREAWDAAGLNVATAAFTERGIKFGTRENLGGLEFRGCGAPISAWLTHPQLFEIFHNHVCSLLRATNVIYFAPGTKTLTAVVASPRQAYQLFTQAEEALDPLAPRLARKPLVWSNGFPKPI
ncbi:hypothetical protein CPHO_04435 [Corynebacterium phocae]|uniref:Uncharacterized protein n=1 Tax=Corynebacterium phocae TaxID=161895 RepID=A0A1L7D693_9CORY|nr:hypothetical protein CPHO_04435 [Corynebacterium phocae]